MEKLNKDDIKKLLSETTVDLDLNAEWENITDILDKDEKNRKFLFWWFGLAMILILSLIVVNSFSAGEELTSKLKIVNTAIQLKNSESSESISQKNKLQSGLLNEIRIGNVEKNGKNHSKINNQDINRKKSGAKLSNLEKTDFNTNNKYLNKNLFGNNIQKSNIKSSKKLSNKPNTTKLNQTAQQNELVNQVSKLNTFNPNFLNNKTLTNISLKPVITLAKAKSQSSFLIYADVTFMKPKTITTNNNNVEYQDRLTKDYQILSQSEVSTGLNYNLSPRWNISFGINYKQYRSVYRGSFTTKTEETIQSDTSVVFTNVIGGNFTQSGDIIQTTSVISEIQQFNYHHRLGFQAGAQFSLTQNLYLGTVINLTALSWQTGQMLSSKNTLSDLNELVNKYQRIDVNFELGWKTNISPKLSFDIGLKYSPNQFLTTIDQVNLNAKSVGGTVRVYYRL